MMDYGMENEVEKDVCQFYGISHEQYLEKIMGIGDTNLLKEFGIEFEREVGQK